MKKTNKIHIIHIIWDPYLTFCNIDINKSDINYVYKYEACHYLTAKTPITYGTPTLSVSYDTFQNTPHCKKCFNHPNFQLTLLKYVYDIGNDFFIY